MAHFALQFDEQPADPRLHELFEKVRRTLGVAQVPHLFLTLGMNPAILSATLESYQATILEGRVPVTLKKLIGQVIAQAQDCPAAALVEPNLSQPANLLLAFENGVGPGDIAALPDRNRAILEFAQRVALTPSRLDQADFEALRQLGLWDDEIFEIITTARFFASLVGLCQTLGLTDSTPAAKPPVTAPANSTFAPLNAAMLALSHEDLVGLTQRLTAESQALTTRLTALTELTLALTGTPVLSEIYQVLTDQAKWVIDFEQVSLCLLDGSGTAYRWHTLIADCRDATCEPVISSYELFPVTAGLAGLALTTNQPVLTGELGAQPQASATLEGRLAATGLSSALILPLHIGERAIGTLNFFARPRDAYTIDDRRIGRLLALQLSAALEAARLYMQIEDERSTLAAVLQSTTQAVLVVGLNGQILIANPAANTLLGFAPSIHLGASLDETITLPALRELFEQVMHQADPVATNVTFPDGNVYRAGIAPVQTMFGETAGYVAVLDDITPLVELDRMKSEFVSTVSHDLKNPITTIQLAAGMLRRLTALDEKQSEMVILVERSAARMLNLVSDLLDLGKIEAGVGLRYAPCELGPLLTETVQDQLMSAEAKQLQLKLGNPALIAGVQVQADRMRLKQVLANLLSNAIKYTPEGGKIQLEVVRVGEAARVCVQDTGYGIPAKALPHIFDKFYRVADTPAAKVEGTGLGLAICRSIIEQHGGQLSVDSVLGKGSTFCFTLPVV